MKRRTILAGGLGTLLLVAVAVSAAGQETVLRQRIKFSGYVWDLRQSEEPGGPQGNRFAGEGRSVFLNSDKSLTLAISRKGELWYGGELALTRSLGYGTYTFRVRSGLSDLDGNVVLGLFSYSDVDKRANDEVDIEFSAWGEPGAPVRGQFVVQPYQEEGHLAFFDLDAREASYSFDWSKDGISFLAWRGYGPRPPEGSPEVISSWTYAGKGSLPDPRRAVVLMNLYLAGYPAPAGNGISSVTIDSFEFLKRR